MPLTAFSRVLPSKWAVGIHGRHAEDSFSQSVYQSPQKSSRTPSILLGKKKDTASISSSTRTKGSRALALFSAFGSLRGRRKVEVMDSIPSSTYNNPLYTGYIDEEYGEPEVEAEEIRRPSGLGRRASITAEKRSDNEDDSMVKDESPRMSEESNDESLVEIRYPSGLGNFKPVLNVFSTERPLSTYPIFARQKSFESNCEVALSECAVLSPLMSTSSGLAAVIPLLAPYLSQQSLFSLTLVDHAVAKQSRGFLWSDVTLELQLSSPKKKGIRLAGFTSWGLINILSSQREVAQLVKSLKFNCRHAITSGKSSRRRPPPLLLSAALPASSRNSSRIQLTNLPSASPGLESTLQTPPASSKIENKDRSFTNLRRASSLVPSTFSLKAKHPEAWHKPSLKSRPPPLSLHKTSPSASRRNQASPSTLTPTPTTGDVDVLSPFKAYSSHNTAWTPPSEWECTPSPKSAGFSSVPQEGWAFSHDSNVKISNPTSSEDQLNLQPSRRIVRDSETTNSENQGPKLRTSLSLPSLHSHASPVASSTHFNLASKSSSLSPMATPSPITPHSAVSLSAFPLPPQTLSPSSASLVPVQPSFSSSKDENLKPHSMLAPGSPTNFGLFQSLASVSANLVHLTHVTLHFDHERAQEKTAEEPDVDAIRTLREFLMKLQSLKNLRVICLAEQEVFHREQWLVLKDTRDNVEVEISCKP